MKIKEMLKKVDAYNEVANMIRTERAKLVLNIEYDSFEVKDVKSFSKEIRDTFIKPMAEAILNGDYKFDEEVLILFDDRWGYKFEERVTACIYTE